MVSNNSLSIETTKSAEPIVLFNQDGISVLLNEINKTKYKTEIKLIIENSSERDLKVSANKYSVNDYMISGSFAGKDVLSGKKLNQIIEIYKSDIEELGIKTNDDFEFDFHLTFSDSSDKFWKLESGEICINV